jgi:hypothetical protein
MKAKGIHKNENQNWYKNQILRDENKKKKSKQNIYQSKV